MVHPGELVQILLEVDNFTESIRHIFGHLNLIRCNGIVWEDFREGEITLGPGEHFQTTVRVSIPPQVPPQWKNCDLTWELLVEDFETGIVRAEDACTWQIQDAK